MSGNGLRGVLVLGGGVAGLTAAAALAKLGLSATIVEISSSLGGHAAQLACKAAPECQRCSVCTLEERLGEVAGADEAVEVLLQAELAGLECQGGGLLSTIERRACLIDQGRCLGCGLCLEVCPQGAVTQAEGGHFSLDPPRCLHAQSGCTACQAACPTGAIDLAARPGRVDASSAPSSWPRASPRQVPAPGPSSATASTATW